MSKSKSSKAKLRTVRRTVKYLAELPRNSKSVYHVLQSAPDGVFRAISNAALNAREGDIYIKPEYKHLFAHHRKHFDILCDNHIPLAHKRQLLLQSGGALPIVVPLIGTVLGSLGAEFISRLFDNSKKEQKTEDE